MLADFAYFLLLLCLFSSIYGALASFAAAKYRHLRLFRSAKMASFATLGLALLAAGLLWGLLLSRDFSVAYVHKISSSDLPFTYTLAAFWASLEGSHFLWTLLLAVYTAIAQASYAKDNEVIMPYVSGTLQAILAWMFYLAVFHSDPFAPLFPAPLEGNGLNPLLQNPYMTFHPPSLFTGYTSLAIPAAYGVAALFYGDINEGWLKSVRRWTLYAWSFLTVGIFLGGRWAYIELGWAGYWAWDPVENSSFLPWLLSTALLHSLLVQDRLGHLKRLSIVLAFFAFFFSFFGTFITRSGVISSVHSFAQSPIGPNYLIFLGALMVLFVCLYALRAQALLPADSEKVWGFSKESALLITQFLLLSFAAIVFIGTLYPIISESITGLRFNIQAPYFNAFAPYLGLAFVLAIGVGNLLSYQSGKIRGGAKAYLWSLLLAIAPTFVFAYFGELSRSQGFVLGIQLLGIFLCFWTLFCLLIDLLVRLSFVRWQVSGFLSRNVSYLGSFLAHIGVLVAVLGFLGNYRGLDKTVTLKHGESTELFGYRFSFDRVETRHVENMTLFEAPLSVHKDGQYIHTVTPARAKYPTSKELFHEVGLYSEFWHDIYGVLADFDKEAGKSATFELHINPTVRLVWLSLYLMVGGSLLCLLDGLRGFRRREL